MVVSEESQTNGEKLSPEDYDKFLNIKTNWLTGMFCIIFVILSGLLYWFSITMRANSNKRVREATYIINRADTIPGKISPRALELEEMKINTQKERDWLLSKMAADSYAKRLQRQLRKKFQQNSFYINLPPDWKSQISPELQKWYNKKRQKRYAQLNRLYQKLPEFVDKNLSRLNRLEKIRKSLELGDTFAAPLKRYESTRKRFRKTLLDLQKNLEKIGQTKLDQPRIIPAVYQAMVPLPDLMNRMALQYRRFSSLVSAPAAYLYAEQFLHDALRIDPKNPEAYYQLGRVYQKLGLDVISSEHYIWALKAQSDFPRGPQIIEMFKKELQQDTTSARAYYNLAFAYHEVGRKQEAKKQLYRVLELEQGKSSMVKVLARKRLDYIKHGASIYNKLTYH